MIGTTNWRRRYIWRANPPSWVRMLFSTPATLAQACRKLTLILLATPPNKELMRFIGSNLKNLRVCIRSLHKRAGFRCS